MKGLGKKVDVESSRMRDTHLKIRTTKRGYRAEDAANAWDRTVNFFRKTEKRRELTRFTQLVPCESDQVTYVVWE